MSRGYCMTFSEARSLMAKARNKSNGKPIGNNTRLYERGTEEDPYYVVRLHNTDIVEIYPNGTYGIRHNGWTTVTTRARIYDFSPLSWRQLISEGGRDSADWFLRVRELASDPEPPENNHIEVAQPYEEPPMPGDEPQSEDFGTCIAGHRRSYTERETGLVDIDRLKSERGYRLALPEHEWDDINNEPNRARSVLRYLKEAANGYVWMSYLQTFVVDYGEESYNWSYGRRSHHKYEQCPHCKAYQKAHRDWTCATTIRRIWDTNVDHYGSFEGWRAGWREDRQRVIDANRKWRAWSDRNRIPWDGLVRINGEGFPLWSEVKDYRSARAARKRSEIRARRAEEERLKLERQTARFKAKYERMKARRKPGITAMARELAATVAEIREDLQVTVSINDSSEVSDD